MGFLSHSGQWKTRIQIDSAHRKVTAILLRVLRTLYTTDQAV